MLVALTPSTIVRLTMGWSSGCGPVSESGWKATTSISSAAVSKAWTQLAGITNDRPGASRVQEKQSRGRDPRSFEGRP